MSAGVAVATTAHWWNRRSLKKATVDKRFVDIKERMENYPLLFRLVPKKDVEHIMSAVVRSDFTDCQDEAAQGSALRQLTLVNRLSSPSYKTAALAIDLNRPDDVVKYSLSHVVEIPLIQSRGWRGRLDAMRDPVPLLSQRIQFQVTAQGSEKEDYSRIWTKAAAAGVDKLLMLSWQLPKEYALDPDELEQESKGYAQIKIDEEQRDRLLSEGHVRLVSWVATPPAGWLDERLEHAKQTLPVDVLPAASNALRRRRAVCSVSAFLETPKTKFRRLRFRPRFQCWSQVHCEIAVCTCCKSAQCVT
jgi:hypothetical protein